MDFPKESLKMHEEESSLSVPSNSTPASSTPLDVDPSMATDQNSSSELQVALPTDTTGR